ncbi:MAG: hypothetical protein E7639_00355 [Ruminococcaceae bacterium]|nr:hypothetical protein [Oscillospiraceae bacterium]
MARVRKGQGAKLVVQILVVLLLSFLLWGILFFEAERTEAALRQEGAAMATLDDTVYATGYVFRDEIPLTSRDNGPVFYAAASGSHLEAGDVLATVYRDGANTGMRAQAAVLLDGIERLQAVDDPDYLPDYYGSYHAMMSSLCGGALPGTDADVRAVQAALALIAARREEKAVREARIASLQAELAALIENDLNASEQVSAPVSGTFYRTVDGYESVMGIAAVDTLTPGGLRALLLSPQSTSAMIGRLLVGQVWYLAVPLSADEAEVFIEGAAYEIDFLRTGESISLTMVRVTPPDTAGEALVIFRADGTPPPADLARNEEIRVTVGKQSGILVPMVALREENGQKGVFVAEDGKARFRTVEVLTERDGCCLVAPIAEEGYLQAGEQIVVTSRRIFDGKVLS